MPVRIVHTADNHVDLSYQRYADEIQARLKAERIDSLRRVVRGANERQAHVLVVAGDLFDRAKAAASTIGEVVKILKEFEGQEVLVLPGNHDHCGDASGGLWHTFRDQVDTGRIRVLDQPTLHSMEIDGQILDFYPCPCTSKTSSTNAIGWVRTARRDPNAIRVGIAHGNVEGLGLDDDDRYFNMTTAELESAGVHCWLLGHIHKPSPTQGGTGACTVFMAGSSTPESVRRSSVGGAWCIDLDQNGVTRFERFRTGALSFHRLTRTFGGPDIEAALAGIENEINSLEVKSTVIDLVFEGELTSDDRSRLQELLTKIKGMGFIQVTTNDQVRETLSKLQIANLYPTGTVAARLLSKLLDSAHPSDASTALNAMRALKSKAN
jgi:DNA repair exonuclease SbcCD nuclease subunit